MSGPKYSRYYLSAAERKKLLKERLEKQKQEAIKKEKERIEKLIQAENQNISSALRLITKQKEVTLKNIQILLHNISNELNKMEIQTQKIKEINMENTFNDYEKYSIQYQKDFKKMQEMSVNHSLKDLNDFLLNLTDLSEKIKQKNKEDKKEILQLKQKLMADVAVKIEKNLAEFSYQDYLKQNSFDSKYYFETLRELSENEKLSIKLQSNIQSVLKHLEKIHEPKKLKDYCLGTISLLISECQLYLKSYDKKLEKFNELLQNYQALALILHEQCQEFELTDSAIEELEEMVKIKTSQAEDELEKQYIANEFNRILIEMGYSLLGQKTKTFSKDKFYCSRLYAYENGNVANVTFSNNGQISIEIGSMDNISRQPTSIEALQQVKSMKKLCEDLPLIEEKLQEKGIYLKQRIAMQPAVKEMAQIINGKDYNISIQKEEYIPIQEELVMYMEDDEWL